VFKCVIPMYGLPYEITALREVEVELKEGAGMDCELRRGDRIALLVPVTGS
jgi:hypothetical protein